MWGVEYMVTYSEYEFAYLQLAEQLMFISADMSYRYPDQIYQLHTKKNSSLFIFISTFIHCTPNIDAVVHFITILCFFLYFD